MHIKGVLTSMESISLEERVEDYRVIKLEFYLIYVYSTWTGSKIGCLIQGSLRETIKQVIFPLPLISPAALCLTL